MKQIIRLDPDAIRQLIETATEETDAVVALFRMVYPQFDDITSTEGYCKSNEKTWKIICNHFMELTKRLNKQRRFDKQVMPGGVWLNWGFSVDNTLKDWQVMPAAVTLRSEQPVP